MKNLWVYYKMDEQEARMILGRSIVKSDEDYIDNELKPSSDGGWIRWQNDLYYVTVDGELNVDQLEALAWWIRNKRRRR